jgi:hypothetical protein
MNKREARAIACSKTVARARARANDRDSLKFIVVYRSS